MTIRPLNLLSRPYFLALLIGWGVIDFPCTGQTPKEAVNANLLADAKDGWKNYEKAARLWSMHVVEKWSSTSPKVKFEDVVSEATVRSNAHCISIEETDPMDFGSKPASKARIVKVYGPEYEFKAKQLPRASDWTLTSVLGHQALQAAIERKDAPADRPTLRDEVETKYLLVAVAMENYLVRTVIDHECCKTERFEALSQEPGALVEWKFTINAQKRPKYMKQIEHGRLVFDPANMWVIRESSLGCKNGLGGITTLSRSFTYPAKPNGTPTPVEEKIEGSTDDKIYRSQATNRYERILHKSPLPDSRFMLSAYGIPEEARTQTHLDGQALSACQATA